MSKTRLLLLIMVFIFFSSCEEDGENDDRFDNNIAFVCNQGSGFLTVIDLETEKIIREIDLRLSLQAYVDKGHTVDEFYVNSPTPHYVQPSFNGKHLYVILTSKNGAIMKMDHEFNVTNFLKIENTTFPAHMQLSKDNSTIYISTWTTNLMGSPDGTSPDNNYMIRLDKNFENRFNYVTPAGAHGIKLLTDESKIIIGHDLSDYINVIDINNLDTSTPLSTAKPIVANPDINGGKNTVVHSPSQLGVSPDNKYAFFACRTSSSILVYDILVSDTLGFIDLKQLYNIQEAGPYSIEVGPKHGYESSLNKYIYVNMKDGGYFGRIKIDDTKSTFNQMFTAESNDILTIDSNNGRPHGLDITDDGKLAVMSSEFSNDNAQEAHTYIIDLENWKINTTLSTKIHSRGVAIYPGVGN